MASFLHERFALYAQSISKPLESRRGCSRLSPYLAWGCLSIRQVYQAQRETARNPHLAGVRRQLAAFASRLRWHCHFIQKFEIEDRMEFENVNRAFDLFLRTPTLIITQPGGMGVQATQSSMPAWPQAA